MKEGNEQTPQHSDVTKRRRKRRGGTKFSSSKAKRYRDALKRTGDSCESPIKRKRYIELQDGGPPSRKEISIRKLILEPVIEESEKDLETGTMKAPRKTVRKSVKGSRSSDDSGGQPQISTRMEFTDTFERDDRDSDSQV